jgi:DNA-binding beta-propeller fold protein YncE
MKKYQLINIFIIALFFSLSALLSKAQEYGNALVKQWGEFGDKPCQFKFPTMIVADKYSNIYVVDQHNHRIQKFDSEGNFILMWGKEGTGQGEFNFPYGIAIDSKGNVFVSDMNNNRIQKFSPTGEFITATGSYGKADGQLKFPYGMAMDEKDVLYVIDAFNYRIQKFDKDLKFLSKWGDQVSIGFKLYMPHEIAISKEGNIILGDRQNHRISFFTKDGALLKRMGEYGEGRDSGGKQFSEPHGVAVDEFGYFFICDRYNFRIHKFSPSGDFLTQWYTSGVFDDSKHFPLGITTTKGGNIYITDHYAHTVQKYK